MGYVTQATSLWRLIFDLLTEFDIVSLYTKFEVERSEIA